MLGKVKEMIIRRIVDGVELVFYPENLRNDNLPLLIFGTEKATTRQMKKYVDDVASYISYLIEAGAIADDRLDKFSKACSVFNALSAIMNGKAVKNLDVEMAKIAIDAVKEIGLMQIKDEMHRKTLKSIAFVTKLLIVFEDNRV